MSDPKAPTGIPTDDDGWTSEKKSPSSSPKKETPAKKQSSPKSQKKTSEPISSPPSASRSPQNKSSKSSPPGDTPSRSPKRLLFGFVFALLVLSAVVAAVVGWLNQRHYFFTCQQEVITASQGRMFPPWGTQPLDGPAWLPIQITPSFSCASEKFDEKHKLEEHFLRAIVERIDGIVKEAPQENVDLIEQLITQGQLLARSSGNSSQQANLTRLTGDVSYWRANAQVSKARAALQESQKLFQDAQNSNPKYGVDAASWNNFVKFIDNELEKGPLSGRTYDGPLPSQNPTQQDTSPTSPSPSEPAGDGGVLL